MTFAAAFNFTAFAGNLLGDIVTVADDVIVSAARGGDRVEVGDWAGLDGLPRRAGWMVEAGTRQMAVYLGALHAGGVTGYVFADTPPSQDPARYAMLWASADSFAGVETIDFSLFATGRGADRLIERPLLLSADQGVRRKTLLQPPCGWPGCWRRRGRGSRRSRP